MTQLTTWVHKQELAPSFQLLFPSGLRKSFNLCFQHRGLLFHTQERVLSRGNVNHPSGIQGCFNPALGSFGQSAMAEPFQL